MPPANSQIKAGVESFAAICAKANTQVHPIAIYMTEENHFGQVTQHAFKIIPKIAILQTMRHIV